MSFSYIVFDADCSICICDRGNGSFFLQVKGEDGTVVRRDLTPQHMRMMGYHGALLYRAATGGSALPADMKIEGELSEAETPPAYMGEPTRHRTRPGMPPVTPPPIVAPVRVRTRPA